jgi:hypothetical protein
MKLSKELQKEFREFLQYKEELQKEEKGKRKKNLNIMTEEEEIKILNSVKEKKKGLKEIRESAKNKEEGIVKRLEKPLKNSEEYSKSLDMIYDFFKSNYKGEEKNSHYKTLSIFCVKDKIYSFGKKHVLCQFVKKTGKKAFTVLLNVSRPSSHTGLQQSFIKRVINQYEEKGFTIKVKEVQNI